MKILFVLDLIIGGEADVLAAVETTDEALLILDPSATHFICDMRNPFADPNYVPVAIGSLDSEETAITLIPDLI
jgi:hypothetical protein